MFESMSPAVTPVQEGSLHGISSTVSYPHYLYPLVHGKEYPATLSPIYRHLTVMTLSLFSSTDLPKCVTLSIATKRQPPQNLHTCFSTTLSAYTVSLTPLFLTAAPFLPHYSGRHYQNLSTLKNAYQHPFTLKLTAKPNA